MLLSLLDSGNGKCFELLLKRNLMMMWKNKMFGYFKSTASFPSGREKVGGALCS
jgi:hypothetical protein